MAFILFEHCIKQKIVTIKHKGVQKRVRGQKFDVIMAIQRQILRESLVFLSFHEFYIHSSNQPIPQVGTSHGITCPRVEHQRKITDTANLKCQFSKMSFMHSLFYSCNPYPIALHMIVMP